MVEHVEAGERIPVLHHDIDGNAVTEPGRPRNARRPAPGAQRGIQLQTRTVGLG
jgi:hypothetical protein